MPTRSITVKARSTTTGNVALQLSYFDGLVGGNRAQIVKPMYDDGTHGDAVAHDGVWTLTFPLELAEPGRLRLYDGQVDSVSISIAATDGSNPLSPSNSIDARVDVAVLSRATESEFPVRAIDATTQATDSMINVVDPAFGEAAIESTMQRVYRRSAQTRSTSRFCSTRAPPATCRVRSVCRTTSAASTSPRSIMRRLQQRGRLQQLVFQNSHMLGLEINHEIGHRWAAYLNRPALNLSAPNGFTEDRRSRRPDGQRQYLLAEAGGTA